MSCARCGRGLRWAREKGRRVAALVVILVPANFIISAFNVRADLTQGSVYTLSPGTKAILAKLEAPVKIRYYYSQGSSALPVALKPWPKLP